MHSGLTYVVQMLFMVAAATGFLSLPSRAAEPTTEPVIQQCIDQLAAADPAERDVAEHRLVSIGAPALELLTPLKANGSPDVLVRVRRIIRQIHLFQLRDVPDTALAAARNYLAATDPARRKHQLNILLQMHPQPNALLSRLVVLENQEDLRRMNLYQLGTGYRDSVPALLVEDDDSVGVLSLLNSAATMWGRCQAADDAMALYLTGDIDDPIEICTAEQINGDPDQQARAAARLCYLYRVCGKYDQALKFARLAHDPSLVFLVLQDQADWTTAAKEPDDRWRDPVICAAFKAAFQRLSGDLASENRTMTAADCLNADSDAGFTPSRFFLLNDMPARGIELLKSQHPATAFSMHVRRGEISTALEIAATDANHPTEGATLKTLSDELRQTLGELPASPAASAPKSPTSKASNDPLADFRDQKFSLVAKQFGLLWAADHQHDEWLYLQGYALKADGKTTRGQALMNAAELIPLGDPQRRWRLAVQLERAGLTDVADHERALALRGGGDFDEVGFSEIYNTDARTAIEKHQWHAAADALDHLCLIHLSPQLSWTDTTRLLTIPALAHLTRACDARAHHDLPGALRELKMYQQYELCSSETVLDWTPALDDIGQHAEADELFNSVYEKLSGICRQYPRSAFYQNDLAWMCACCGRELDEALKAAEICAALRPEDDQVLDTLAEVHFRRGERDDAIAVEKRALALKQNPYLARQLMRMQSYAIPPTTQPGSPPR
jgi:tetratricopeptide (TPR) repeat protein